MNRAWLWVVLIVGVFVGTLLWAKNLVVASGPVEPGVAPLTTPVVPSFIGVQRVPNRAWVRVYGASVGVPILMFHRIAPKPKTILEMTAQEFLAVLTALKTSGYCPVLLHDYLANRFPVVCEGKKMFVATFDDAHPSQLALDASGNISNASMLGLWQKVFPESRATFFVNTKNGGPPFGKDSKRKLALLVRLGYPLENHTVNHPYLNRVSAVRVAAEIANICKTLGRKEMLFAYPYGFLPTKPIDQYQSTCRITAAFGARTGYFEPRPRGESEARYPLLAPLPVDPRFSALRLKLPRININGLKDLRRDILENPGVYRLEAKE